MYCAAPDGSSACHCPSASGGTRGKTNTLAGYSSFSSSPYDYTFSGGSLSYDPGGAFSSTPGGYSSNFSPGDFLGDVWNQVRGVLGDVATDLKDDVVDWIQRRIGQEAWSRMPETSKREAIRTAATEISGGLTAPGVLPWVLAGAAGLWAFSRGRR